MTWMTTTTTWLVSYSSHERGAAFVAEAVATTDPTIAATTRRADATYGEPTVDARGWASSKSGERSEHQSRRGGAPCLRSPRQQKRRQHNQPGSKKRNEQTRGGIDSTVAASVAYFLVVISCCLLLFCEQLEQCCEQCS